VVNIAQDGAVAWTKAPEEERRRQILDAALRVAARDGLRGLTLRAVAAEAGLSHGLVLFHFGRKQALVDALLDAALAWLAARATPAGPPRRVCDVVAAQTADIDPVLVSVLLDFWMLAAVDEAVRARITAAVTHYEAGLAEVVAGRDDDERRRHAGVATTLVFGTALRSLLAGRPPGPAAPGGR
jgi:AcrR family transcriptional regulator